MTSSAEQMPEGVWEKRMPVLFVGHGNPMNAIEDNEFSRRWRSLSDSLPEPRAILCISAHWETRGTRITAMETPRTIHDFGGFPAELYEVEYRAPGSRELAAGVRELIGPDTANLDMQWGLDHGCWSVLSQMYPHADIPVVQLSLDRNDSSRAHYEKAGKLANLREKGVLILCSGNMVHNLGRMTLRGDSFNDPFGFDWAVEANELFKRLIREHDHAGLIDFASLGPSVQLAIPSSEHFLPLLYALALQREEDDLAFFNDVPVAGSLSMTSLRIG